MTRSGVVRLLTAFLFAAAATRLFAATYTSSQSGNWCSLSTWGGVGVPGAGDTANVLHTVTLDLLAARQANTRSLRPDWRVTGPLQSAGPGASQRRWVGVPSPHEVG